MLILNRNIFILKGDISLCSCDCVVNAANNSLLGGGGVDGAIHRAAGPRLLEICAKIGGVKTSEAVITPAFDMNCKYIIHTAGPRYLDPLWRERLKNSYLNSFKKAEEYELKSIAFPAISNGAYGIDMKESLYIVFDSLVEFLKAGSKNIKDIYYVLYKDEYKIMYEKFFNDKIKTLKI